MAEPLSARGQDVDAADVAPRAHRLEVPPALPEQVSPVNPRLNQSAESIGGALGSSVREVKERFQVLKGGAGAAGSTVAHLKQRAGDTVEQARQRASEAVQQATDKACEAFETVRQQAWRAVESARTRASEKIGAARRRASYVANEYPVHVVLGAAAGGFVLGILLRVWRSNRGE